LNPDNSLRLFTIGTLLSQIISNIPTTIFLSRFSSNWKILAFAVNIGGIGTVIASFANLIALRFIDHPHKVLLFSKYAFLFLPISFVATALVFF